MSHQTSLKLVLKGPILNYILRIDGKWIVLRSAGEGCWEREIEYFPLGASTTINLYAEGIDHQPWSLTVKAGSHRPLTLRGRFREGRAERLEELDLKG